MSVNSSECPACGVTFRPAGTGSVCPRCGRVPPGWYYSRDGKTKIGPIGTNQLKELSAGGRLAPTDLVRRAADSQWRRAERVRGLFPERGAPVPPPVPLPAVEPVRDARIDSRHEARAEAQVVPDPARCVQCGICSYNCPMEIDVRAHAHRGTPIHDSHCLTCSECVKRCPRGVLSFERIPLFTL